MKKLVLVITLMLVVLLLPVLPVLAGIPGPPYTDCSSYALSLDGYLVCFVGATDNLDGTSTWTYALEGHNFDGQQALSHWTLELCAPAYQNVVPGDGDTYTTIERIGNITGRPGIVYDVAVGQDGNRDIFGIKFEDANPQLDGGDTDIFQFTLLTDDTSTTPTTVAVGVKAALGAEYGFIAGPACDVTAITLASFNANAGAGDITLAWETGTEIDNAGFNLYRAPSADGPWSKVNVALIAARGDAVAGASYSFVDTPGNGTFFYRLQDVDYNGVGELHGPVTATLAAPFRRPLHRPTLPAN